MRVFYGAKDRPADLRDGMERTLARLAAATEGRPTSPRQATR